MTEQVPRVWDREAAAVSAPAEKMRVPEKTTVGEKEEPDSKGEDVPDSVRGPVRAGESR
jgi:hypothetical protein